MSQKEKEALVEGLKEIVRTGIIAAIPAFIACLESGIAVDWKLVWTAVLIAVLRGLDKWLHELDVRSPLDLRSMDRLK